MDRRSVLARLEQVLRRLVQMMGKEKRLPQAILDAAGGKVYTYGSFELGVYGPGSDIDTLMLAPKHVSRDHFFSHIEDLLRGEFRPVEITELTPVPGIAVPIVKLEVCGVSVDLIFCSLQVSSVTTAAIDMTDVSVLRGLNEVDRRCVNGTRVTRRILELVPETKTFRTTLRAVKLWAKRRALYGNIVGFPGGVAWALMVARVCQLYPRASASKLLLKFFQIMLSWRWPTPVKLCPDEPAPFELMQWDPQLNYGDRRHLMPVITPCFPTANAIHTVGPSTKRIIVREWRRAAGLVARIHDDAPRTPWRELFQRHDFFVRAYKHYITVVTAGKTRDASQAWAGLVESKVKHLVRGIEMSEATSIDLVHPFNKGFRRVHRCRGPNEQDRVCDGSMAHQVHDASSVEEASPTPDAANGTTPPSPAAAPNGSSATDPGHTPPTPADTVWTVTFYLGIDLRPGLQRAGYVGARGRVQGPVHRLAGLRRPVALDPHQARTQVGVPSCSFVFIPPG